MRTNFGLANGWIIAGTVIAMAACGGREVDLGGSQSGTSASTGGQSRGGASSGAASSTESYGGIAGARACTVAPFPDVDAGAAPGAALAPLVGTWTGYAENLMTGPGDMTLVFTQQPDGSVTGSLAFGSGPQPAPPTAKTDVFPPGFEGFSNGVQYPFSGFPYSALQVSFDGTRLQLGIARSEFWKTWCGLQTSYDWAPGVPGTCGCLPDWASMGSPGQCEITRPDTGAKESVDCALVAPCLASPLCSCTSAGCSFDTRYPTSTLDVQLASNRLDGSMSGFDASPLNVHLTRSP
jgi:hypothetical protein